MSSIHPFAKAKVSVEMTDGDVMLSIEYKTESGVEFMKWIGSAIEYYQAKLNFDLEYANATSFVIDYRFDETRRSITVMRHHTEEIRGTTYM